MKLIAAPLIFYICLLALISSAFANVEESDIDNKQTNAIQLINALGAKDQEGIDYAYSGFMARFQAVRSDREDLARKQIVADNLTLELYSKQLDRLIADLEAYSNGPQ